MKKTPPTSLSGSHRHTYEAIFRHPAAHNLSWRDVHALLRHLAQVVEEPNGNLKVTRHGQVLILRPPRTKDVAEISELVELRHFLARSDQPVPEVNAPETHGLVVIDHQQARIYRTELHGSVPERILPFQPADDFRRARDQEKRDQHRFFEPVAAALKNVRQILVFGSGKGSSSEMGQFTSWLEHHHPEIAARIVGSLVVDEHHLTEAQLLAKAREFYASLPEAAIAAR